MGVKPILGHAPEGENWRFYPGGYATDGHLATRLLSQGRGLPMGLPSTHRRPRIHSTYCARPLHRRLHGEPPFERVPRHPRPRLRPALRAGLPPRPRRGKAGGHLPPEARRRGSTRTTSAARLPKIPEAQERQEGGADRRGLRLADRGQRPHAARLLGHHLRAVGRAGRPHAHQHSRRSACRPKCSTTRSRRSWRWASTSSSIIRSSR